MRAVILAGLAIGAMMPGGLASAEDGASFLGFRLLNLENQNVKWQTPTFGRSAIVTYAFATQPIVTAGARNCGSLLPPERAYEPSNITTPRFEAEVAAAFRMWEKVADITFRKTNDVDTAGIVIGAQGVPIGRAFTNVALKLGTGDKKIIARSLICLNPQQPWKIGFDGRLGVYDLRYTIAHEIGHAIGLDHPSAAGQLMSYRYDEKQAAPQPGDVQGAALLYGPRPETPRVAATSDMEKRVATEPADSGWPFGIGAKRGSGPAQAPEATGSVSPAR